jgi:hypothetical protein
MGNGIIVILSREDERYVRSGGRPITAAALAYHAFFGAVLFDAGALQSEEVPRDRG